MTTGHSTGLRRCRPCLSPRPATVGLVVVTGGVSPTQVRDELEQLLERDLLGPRDGPEEELRPGELPAERYLLGRLVPRPTAQPASATRTPAGPDRAATTSTPTGPDPTAPELADADLAAEPTPVDAEADDDRDSTVAVRSGTMAASALGLSFLLPGDVDAIRVTPRWGRYSQQVSRTAVTEQGRPRQVWKRNPGGGTALVVPLDRPRSEPIVADDGEGVTVAVTVRNRDDGAGALRHVHVALVNGLEPLPATPDRNRLYQAELEVTALDGETAVFVGHNDPELTTATPHADHERAHLDLIHRGARRYATGSQVAVAEDVRPGESRAWRLRTSAFPAAELAPIVPADAATMPGLVTDMQRLGELDGDDLVAALRPLTVGYTTWLAEQRVRADADAEIRRYRSLAGPAADVALDDAAELAGRLDRAIDLLRDDATAREAFRFANLAMARQRVRSDLLRERPRSTVPLPRLLAGLDVPRSRSWRPFQLAFVLLCVPGLTDPAHPDAHRGPDDGQVQLLFFPTGGGKTEAYLGLTAYTFAIRRLQGVVGDGDRRYNGTDGVAVLMRYTLRLLTAQQFQRAATLVCACETLRRERLADGDGRWGRVPFRLGMWVGSSVTPNSYDEAAQRLSDYGGGGVFPLPACPWCATPLQADRDAHADAERRRTLLYCGDEDGTCPFSRARSPKEGLPVLTVDEEIYRLTPALVISTVDKIARLAWVGGSAPLFGLVDSRCPRHGWRTVDTERFCRTGHRATARLPAAQAEPALRLRPPDLVVQDELHLISDALGSMVGLYETGVDRLASRAEGGRTVRPVVVASTATVRRAQAQVRQVFARGLAVFPPQVLDAGQTFFSRRIEPSPEQPGRRYRGICAPGERIASTTIRVYGALLAHGQHLIDRHGEVADPYATLVGYFTATRDLAAARRLVEDDVAERLSRSDLGRPARRRPNVRELTSRMPSEQITGTLAEMERVFDPERDSTAALQRFRALSAAERTAAREAEGQRLPPIDVLLATSMLQVGVDVPRLGLMVVNGQPKSMTEYIQASSRVGRGAGPGLVLTVYRWNRPRDLAHLESFGYDHATFGLRVEGVTTTPFSDRALDRGLTGAFVTALRHSEPAAVANEAVQTLDLDRPEVAEIVAAFGERAAGVTYDKEDRRQVEDALRHRLDSWAEQRRQAVRLGSPLGYTRDGTSGRSPLLRRPGPEPWHTWSTPESLRTVEPEIDLHVYWQDRSLDAQPDWEYGEAEDPSGDAGATAAGGVGAAKERT